MKLHIPTMLLILGIGFSACNSDRRDRGDTDSLMTDSSVMDTATTGAGIADTAVTDSIPVDSTTKDTAGPVDKPL